MLKFMKENLDKVSAVRFTSTLVKYPVCLTSEGELSVEMEKILKRMPGADGQIPTASVCLEININHPIAEKLKSLYATDKERLGEYAKILYSVACLIGGISVDNPAEFTEFVADLMI